MKAALAFASSKRGIASQDGSRQAETGIAWLCAQHEQPGPEGRRLIGSCWVVLVISEETAVRNRPPAVQELMQIPYKKEENKREEYDVLAAPHSNPTR